MGFEAYSRRFSSILPLLGLVAACKGQDITVTDYNTDPVVTIQEPVEGTILDAGQAVSFRGLVVDGEDDAPDLTLSWTSALDGLLDSTPADIDGMTVFTTANLSEGSHAITLSVVDTGGRSAQDSVTIAVDGIANNPTIEIRAPEIGELGLAGEETYFEAAIADKQDAVGTLVVTFSSDLDDLFCEPVIDELGEGVGLASCDADLSPGVHLLTFTVTDSDGNSGEAAVSFEVVSPLDIDDDGDGFTENQGDCDDATKLTSPTGVEIANGTDDDCDGLIDEGTDLYDADGDCFCANKSSCTDSADDLCTAPAPGDCNDDATTGAAFYPGAAEIGGDSVDQNCDGKETCFVDADKDAFRTTVTVESPDPICAAGDGEAVTTAGIDCNDNAASINPSAVEIVGNEIDEDCDGGEICYDDVDADNYRHPANVRESTDADCGDTGEGQAADVVDCNDGEATIYPGAPDAPDDSFVDTNCDTFDGDAALAIFVSEAGNDGSTGLSVGAAVRSLGRALIIASTNPARTQILVATGSYTETLSLGLRSGVGLYGGYGAGFTTRSNAVAVFTSTATTGIVASGLAAPTTIDRINIATTDPAGAGAHTIAISAVSSGSNLIIRNGAITAGRGGSGTSGSAGSNGGAGANGGGGSGAGGGAGGSPGGGGGGSGVNRGNGTPGAPGATYSAAGGAGGQIYGGGRGCGDGNPENGGNGGNGGNGTIGSGGAAGSNLGTLSAGVWTTSDGGGGGAGGQGGAGGGGGGGGGENCTTFGVCVYCDTGRGGGGGGGAGGGGGSSTGGTSGGASIALAIHSSNVALHNVAVTTAGGGNGGAGGSLGTGGNYGNGGAGALKQNNSQGSGGNGGRGGAGGNGGCAGGGGGGPSIGAWGTGTSPAVTITGSTVLNPGSSGGGGPSCGSSGQPGVRAPSQTITVQ